MQCYRELKTKHNSYADDSQQGVGQDERWLMFVTLRSPLEVSAFEAESLSWDDQTSEETCHVCWIQLS